MLTIIIVHKQSTLTSKTKDIPLFLILKQSMAGNEDINIWWLKHCENGIEMNLLCLYTQGFEDNQVLPVSSWEQGLEPSPHGCPLVWVHPCDNC